MTVVGALKWSDTSIVSRRSIFSHASTDYFLEKYDWSGEGILADRNEKLLYPFSRRQRRDGPRLPVEHCQANSAGKRDKKKKEIELSRRQVTGRYAHLRDEKPRMLKHPHTSSSQESVLMIRKRIVASSSREIVLSPISRWTGGNNG